ncbi:hypothetical protein [Aneurinibacillus tyrosinisolvens]|uniref:hypothetical protein n=1 Tax=Aneurinibacillus tyrosinisolvens TaxID=1443435 RepID=UPI00063F94BB|nr:hypothetical protein [Aneurinibacillus tyrosinisolvens]
MKMCKKAKKGSSVYLPFPSARKEELSAPPPCEQSPQNIWVVRGWRQLRACSALRELPLGQEGRSAWTALPFF